MMHIGLSTSDGKESFFPRRRLFHVKKQVDTKRFLDIQSQEAEKKSMDELPSVVKEVPSKSKVVLFFKNGDRNFRGLQVTVNSRRIRNFDNLLNELTRITNLPQGVRFIFTPISGNKIESLEQILDGHAYVCGSYSKFKKINYVNLPFIYDPNRKRVEKKYVQSTQTHPSTYKLESLALHQKPAIAIKPKIVTIVRNSVSRPKKSVRILLNRRTAQTFDQVLNDITEAVGVEGGCVRKLYNVDGKLVHNITELFSGRQIFIAVGNERFRSNDLPCIVEDFKINSDKPSIKQISHMSNNYSRIKQPNKVSWKGKQNHDKLIPQLKSLAANRKTKKSDEKTSENKLSGPPLSKKTPLPPISCSNSIIYENENEKNGKNKTVSNHPSHNVFYKKDENTKFTDVINNQYDEKPMESDSLVELDKNVTVGDISLDLKNGISLDSSLNKIHDEKPKTIINKTSKRYIDYKLSSNNDINLFFDVGSVLGDGNFAVVKSAKDKYENVNYALKVIDSTKITGKGDMLRNEITIQRESFHPNIVHLIHDFHSPTEIFLAMELITGGDFFDFIAKNVKLEELDAIKFTKDICSGLDYLHDKSIVHRDIKPENLMVHISSDNSITLKIADFGLAQKVTKPIFTVCGTPTYVSPEILKEEGYGVEVDVWAAGVIIYIMLCGFPPFRSPNRRQSELFDLIEKSEFEFLEPYWDDISESAKDLIRKVLVADVKKRYTCKNILNHLWLIHANVNYDRSRTMPVAPSPFKVGAIGVQAVERMKVLGKNLERGEYLIPYETT